MRIALGGLSDAFSSRNFRVYWVGNFVHTNTVWINRLAVAWMTWELTHSPAWLGVMAASNMVPMILLGPIAGVTADRYGHRFQLVTGTYIAAVIAIVLTVFVWTGSIFVELLLALNIAAGIVRAFNVPARTAMIHGLVDRRHLSSAMGVNSATFHGGNFLGPAVGGLIISVLGISWAFLAYAVGEIIAATSFLLLRIEERQAADRGRFNLVGELAAGIRYTFGHPGIRALMALGLVTAVFLMPYIEMMAGFASQVFGRGAEGLAFLTSSSGAGAMAGGLWIAWRGRTDGLVRILITAQTIAILALLGFVATDIFPVAMAALVFVGAGMVCSQASSQTLIQTTVASEMRARVISFVGVIVVTGPAIGAIAIGAAAEHFGMRLPFAVSAVLALTVLAVLARPVLRTATALEAAGQAKAG